MSTNTITTYNADDDFVNIRKSDIITPRLAILQSTSPETKIRGSALREGDWIIKDDKRIVLPYAAESEVLLTPIFWFMNWIEWNPNRDCKPNEKILDSSFDAQGDLAKMAERFEMVQTPKGPKVRVTESYNFIVAIGEDFDDVAVMSFQRASHKVGKDLVNRAYKAKGVDGGRSPLCFNQYSFSTIYIDEGADRKYYAPIINGKLPTPEAARADLLEKSQFFKSNREQIAQRHMEREQAEQQEAAADTSAADKRGI